MVQLFYHHRYYYLSRMCKFVSKPDTSSHSYVLTQNFEDAVLGSAAYLRAQTEDGSLFDIRQEPKPDQIP